MITPIHVVLKSNRKKVYFIYKDLPDRYVLAEINNPYFIIEKDKNDPELEFIDIDSNSEKEFLEDLRMEQREQG